VLDVVQLVNGYKSLFLRAHPLEGDDAIYKAIVVVFTDVPAERAKDSMDGVLQQLADSSYVEDGAVLGEFYEGNEGAAIYNPSFRPFTPPVPFLLMRPTVSSDWKFFWTTRTGSASGRVVLESPQSRPLLGNYAAPTGGGSDSDAARQAYETGIHGHPRGKIVLTVS
jgi:hypothetical protein